MVSRNIVAISVTLVCLLAAGAGSTLLAKTRNQTYLPPGYYIYLGTQPGQQSPKGFTVSTDQSVIWQNNASQAVDSTEKVNSSSLEKRQTSKITVGARTPSLDNWFDKFEYPYIKWKPKPLGSRPTIYAQLSTTYVDGIKYQLTVFESPIIPNLNVQLLDQNGFKLAEFTAHVSDFHVIPGTSVLEAKGNILGCSEEQYKLARDFSADLTR